MADIIKAITELLREVGKMAGGRVRGQIAFWVVFALIVALCIKPAYESISSVLGYLHITIPPWFLSNFLVSLGLGLVSVIFLAAIGFGIGALISAILTLFLGSRIERATDDVLDELLAIVDNARTLQTDYNTKLELEKLYPRLQQIREKQHKRVANRIVRWFRGRSKKEEAKE